MKFRKKPVVIEAIQYKGTKPSVSEVFNFVSGNWTGNSAMWERFSDHVIKNGLSIDTLEGTMLASVNDWIIKGVNGEFYPCKPDIFEKTYEAI